MNNFLNALSAYIQTVYAYVEIIEQGYAQQAFFTETNPLAPVIFRRVGGKA